MAVLFHRAGISSSGFENKGGGANCESDTDYEMRTRMSISEPGWCVSFEEAYSSTWDIWRLWYANHRQARRCCVAEINSSIDYSQLEYHKARKSCILSSTLSASITGGRRNSISRLQS